MIILGRCAAYPVKSHLQQQRFRVDGNRPNQLCRIYLMVKQKNAEIKQFLWFCPRESFLEWKLISISELLAR
jgi:hypothetical protein